MEKVHRARCRESSELGITKTVPCISTQVASRQGRGDISYNLLISSALELGTHSPLWARGLTSSRLL